MKTWGRGALAVVAGAVVWAAIWIPATRATQIAFPEIAAPDRYTDHVGLLLFYIALGAVGLSVLAGWITAAVAGARPMPAVWVLAGLQLAMGIVAEVSYWDLLPVWYHVVFLALVVPMTVAGGKLRRDRSPAVARAHAMA